MRLSDMPPLPRFSSARAALVLTTICALFVLLVGRVAYLQTYGRQQTIRRAERQQHQREIIHARRGSIFDSHGSEFAGTIQTQACFADPKFMQETYQQDHHSLVEMDQAVARLASVLDKAPIEMSQ